MDPPSGKSGPKDQVALHYYYTSPSHWYARLTRYRNCKFHNFASTISRHADGISRYSVPPSAGPLLPLDPPTFLRRCTPLCTSLVFYKVLSKKKRYIAVTQIRRSPQRYDGLYLRFLGRARSGLSTSSATARRRPADNRVIGYSSRPRETASA